MEQKRLTDGANKMINELATTQKCCPSVRSDDILKPQKTLAFSTF